MILHKSAYKIFIVLAGLILIDLITRSLWLTLLYVAGWSFFIFRKSDNVIVSGLTFPCTGEVQSVSKVVHDGVERTIVTVNTRPVVDSQEFLLIPGQMLSNVRTDLANKVLNYKSGVSVTHAPNLAMSLFEVEQPADEVISLSDDLVSGYSIFGATTTISMPCTTKVYEGQKVIAGQTKLGDMPC